MECPNHPGTKLFCPRCIGSRGGRVTNSRHKRKLSKWGRSGGRPRKHAAGKRS